MNHYRQTADAGRLRGSGIDIHVGTSALPCDQWSLPINLISHHSPYLKAASTSNDEGPVAKINLPEHEPAVFGLFVEWMYYGRYDTQSLAPDPNIDAKCWILGDMLGCPDFKNFVMGLLYTQHIILPFAKSVTCEEVQFVCDNTSSSTKLRQYYESFVVSYYATADKLLGSTEDWDALFQKHSGMRVALLQSMRHGFTEGSLMKDLSAYLESTEGLLKPEVKPNQDSTTSPTEEEIVEAAQCVKVQDGLEWTFFSKEDEAAAGLPSRVETETDEEDQEESQTSVDGKAQDEVRHGASTMHHVPEVDAGSRNTTKGSEQEDTDETLVNSQPWSKSKKKKNKRNKAKGYLVTKTAELSVGDDRQADHSSSELDTEQVRTEQTEAEATPEPADDEGNVSTDSEPDSFADLVKTNRERQEAGVPQV